MSHTCTIKRALFTAGLLFLITHAAAAQSNLNFPGTIAAQTGIAIINPNATFNVSAPVDDLPNFVPGSDLAGNSLPVPTPSDGSKEIQTLTLHLLTDPAITGTVKYQLTNVSSYPGIAMNLPISKGGVGPDLGFDKAFDLLRR